MYSISFNKFQSLLEKHGYKIARLYCVDQYVKVIECRTPIFQRTFMVNITERYKMKVPEEIDLEIKYMSQSEEHPQRQLNYLLTVKTGQNENICSLTYSSLLISENEDIPLFYLFKTDKQEEESNPELLDETESQIDTLEKRITVFKPPVVAPIPEPIVEPIESDGEGEITLVFQDEDGNAIDETKTFIDLSQDLDTGKEQEVEIEELIADDIDPEKIEEEQFVIGAIFVVFNLSSLTKLIKENQSLEEVILTEYRSIEKNEVEQRTKRLEQIHSLVQQFLKVSTIRLSDIAKEETKLRQQLLRLSVILKQTSILAQKSDNKDVAALRTDTERTITELNINLVQLRDRADGLLVDYELNIKEILDL